MHITRVAVFLFAAMGAVATPTELDARTENSAQLKYPGTCTRENNQCKYKGQNNRDTFVKCPTFANKKCTRDGAPCSFDSYSRVVTCD